MAGRRCFSDKIVESDAFYALSASAQALYYHLNQAADDDGFINNASSIASRIKGGKTALSDLVKARFLLQFGSLYVVKHWRISNSLKNDRLKPPQYPNISSKIWLKPNRAYTDHPVEGCNTLLEVKNGIHLESVWNPNRTEPNKNRREPNKNRTEPDGIPEDDFTELWMAYPEEKRGVQQLAKEAFCTNITSHEDAIEALDNLKLWKQSEQWNKDGGQYMPYLNNWIIRGAWKVKPTKMAIPQGASGELGEAEMEAIRHLLSAEQEEIYDA